MLGIGLRYSRRSRSLGGRAAQYVEADPAGGPMVPRRQPASVAPLFAVPRAATESANGRAFDASLWLAERSPRELRGRCARALYGGAKRGYTDCRALWNT